MQGRAEVRSRARATGGPGLKFRDEFSYPKNCANTKTRPNPVDVRTRGPDNVTKRQPVLHQRPWPETSMASTTRQRLFRGRKWNERANTWMSPVKKTLGSRHGSKPADPGAQTRHLTIQSNPIDESEGLPAEGPDPPAGNRRTSISSTFRGG